MNKMSAKIATLLKRYKYSALFGLILLSGTLIFLINVGEYDKAITSRFYNESLPPGERFYLADSQPWKFFNEYNDYFTYFMALTFIIPWLISFFKKDMKWCRKFFLFAIVTAIFVPGVLVNNVFKGLWGRPRPRDTYLWPNSTDPKNYPWYPVWYPVFLYNPDLIGKGVSFPSGHVSIIAAFILYYYLFKNTDLWALATSKSGDRTDVERKRRFFTILKWSGVGISMIIGILTGIARIVAGAHHASDVLWAFGIVYIFTAIFYYYIFRIPKYERKLMENFEKKQELAENGGSG